MGWVLPHVGHHPCHIMERANNSYVTNKTMMTTITYFLCATLTNDYISGAAGLLPEFG